MLKFEQLYYLYLVHRFNSVKIAAESIPVTPSAVSTAIHKLEKEIGISLLERTYRGIELTEPACKIAEAFGKVVEQMENVQKIIEQTNSKALDVQDKKHLTLYLSRGYYQGNLTDIFNMFEKFGIEVNVPDTSCGNERYLQFVNDDKNAVLLNFFTEPVDKILADYPNVRFIRIATSRPCVYCSKDYPLLSEDIKEITPKEVLKLPLLMFSEGYDLALPIFEMLETHGKPNIVGKYNNIAVLSAFLTKNKGVSVCSENYLVFWQHIGSMEDNSRVIPIKTEMRISVLVCYNKKLSEEIQKILQTIAKETVYAKHK